MQVIVLVDFMAGLFLTLLPQRYRSLWLPEWQGSLRRSAVVSGTVQILLCLAALLLRYPRFVDSQLNAIPAEVFMKAAERGGDTSVRGFGIILLFAYVLTPLSLLLIYFVFEGTVRLTAALTTGEVVGSLPFLIVEKSVSKIEKMREEKRQGPRIPDVVSAPPLDGSGYDLAVSSCRAKPNWNESMTVSYQDRLFEVMDYIEAAPPRRHVYLLRKAPEHKVVRGLHHYDPEEVLEEGN